MLLTTILILLGSPVISEEVPEYCHREQQFSPDGAIAKYGSGLYRVCTAPNIQSDGKRSGPVWLSAHILRQLNVHAELFQNVRGQTDIQKPRQIVIKDRQQTLAFLDQGHLQKIGVERYSGAAYDLYIGSQEDPETGGPNLAYYVYVGSDVEELPPHYASCGAPKTKKLFGYCRLQVQYKDVWLAMTLGSSVAPIYVQKDFPNIVSSLLNVAKHIDVTDTCCLSYEGLQIFD